MAINLFLFQSLHIWSHSLALQIKAESDIVLYSADKSHIQMCMQITQPHMCLFLFFAALHIQILW